MSTFETQHPRNTDGRFATKSLSESDTALVPDMENLDETQARQLLDFAVKTAQRRARATGIGERQNVSQYAEEVASDAMAQLLTSVSNGKRVENPYGYLRVAIQGLNAKSFRDEIPIGHDTQAAWRRFNDRKEAFEVANGTMGAPEREQLMREVLAEYEGTGSSPSVALMVWARQGERPEHMRRVIHLNEIADREGSGTSATSGRRPLGEDMALPASLKTASAEDTAVEQRVQHAADRVSHMADAEGSTARGHRNRRASCDSLAQLHEQRLGQPIPRVQARSIGRAERARIQQTIRDAGGARRVLADYLAGKSSLATEAFFTPWGKALTPRDRDGLADMLSSHPSYTDDLWSSALSASTRDTRVQA